MLRNLSIKLRLAIIVAMGMAGLLTLTVVQLLSERASLHEARVREITILSEVAGGVMAHFHSAYERGEVTLEEAQTQARDVLRDLRFGNNDYFYSYDVSGTNVILGPAPEREGTDMIDVVDPNGVPLIRELIGEAANGGGVVAYEWARAGSDAPVPKIGYAAPFEPWGWFVGTGVYVDDLDAAFRGAVLRAAGVVALVVLVVAGVASMIARTISSGIAGTTRTMHRLAGGETALTVPYRDQRDEIGKMAKAVEVFRVNAVEKRRLEAEQEEMERRTVAEKRAAMAQLADDFEASVGEIIQSVSSAATEMQSTAQAMAAVAEETNRQSAAVTSAAEEVAANVQTVAAAAEELGSSIGEISRQMSLQAEVADESAQSASLSDNQIKGLAERVNGIGDVVSLITGIADQTNLLALNATIEAARAGDAGKGFAVVASEVKGLAGQTAKATEQIAGQIQEIQDQTGQAVEAIGGINIRIERIKEVSSSIAAAIEQQNAAANEIGRNTQEASMGTQQVSSSIVGVNEASAQAGESASNVLTAAEDLSRQSEHLAAEVAQFMARVRAA